MSSEENEENDGDAVFVDAVTGNINTNNNNNNNSNNNNDASDVIVPQTQGINTGNAASKQDSQSQAKRAVGRPKKTAEAAANSKALAVVAKPQKPPRKKVLSNKRKMLTAVGEGTSSKPSAAATTRAASAAAAAGPSPFCYENLALVNVESVAKCVGTLMRERGDKRLVDPTFVFLLASGVQKHALAILQAADTFRSIATDVKLVNGRHITSADAVLRMASGDTAPIPAYVPASNPDN